MNDQRMLWDKLHKKGKVDNSTRDPSSFAEEVQKIIPHQSRILELGCGVGNDSFYFSRVGHTVLATDFSEVAIENNRKKFEQNNIKFKSLDISKPFSFPNESFDVIYARLSLHYFTDKVTKQIFKELYRILKSNGFLCFLCKSTEDPVYGKGKLIERDMFEENGHIRHFFSTKYVEECLKGLFKIKILESGKDNFYNNPSAFIKVIAIK